MPNKYILYFKNNDAFDIHFQDYLIERSVNTLIINQKEINDWQFLIEQDTNGRQSGAIISPRQNLYDLSDAIGIYIRDFKARMYTVYEHNAWHALLSWLMETIPNCTENYVASNNFNNFQMQKILKQLGIEMSNKDSSHIIHCVGNNLFASTINQQMAILPPTFARKLLQTTKLLNLNCGQYSIINDNNVWKVCSFMLRPNWEECAFPQSFIFQELHRVLTQKKPSKWQKISNPITPKPVEKSFDLYIKPYLLPKLTAASYYPACH